VIAHSQFLALGICVIDAHIVSANVVIGDLDTKGAEKVVAEIVELGG
jgi:hypothetical protein